MDIRFVSGCVCVCPPGRPLSAAAAPESRSLLVKSFLSSVLQQLQPSNFSHPLLLSLSPSCVCERELQRSNRQVEVTGRWARSVIPSYVKEEKGTRKMEDGRGNLWPPSQTQLAAISGWNGYVREWPKKMYKRTVVHPTISYHEKKRGLHGGLCAAQRQFLNL